MRHDDSKPFDIEAREAADITQQFWGASRGWDRSLDDTPSEDMWADRTPRSIQAIKVGLTGMRPRRPQRQAPRADATGRVDRTRSHGIVRPAPPSGDLEVTRREASLAELAAGWLDDDDWSEFDLPRTEPTRRTERDRTNEPSMSSQRVERDSDGRVEFDSIDDVDDDDLVPLSPVAPLAAKLGLGAVDPLLARLGAIVVIGVLLLPLALSARGRAEQPVLATGGAASVVVASLATAGTTPASTAASLASSGVRSPVSTAAHASTTANDNVAGAQVAGSVSQAASAPSTEATPASAAVPTSDQAADVPQSVSVATTDPVEVATVSEPASRLEPECSMRYEAGVGDSWYRIADAAGVSPRSLIDTNLASLDTLIFPGDEICLPDGAAMPSKPLTTTAAPAATAAPTTAPPATTPPTTATTTTAPPPPTPVSTSKVQELIREIWPDDLEERALQIAYRESNYKATAYNGSCCYGVFQIHWSSHKSWLGAYGITSTNDLLDARKNITAAYALYQRSGGWGPWGG